MDESARAAREQFDRALEIIRTSVSGSIALIEVLRAQNETLGLALQTAIHTIEVLQGADVDPYHPAILDALEALRVALLAPPALALQQQALSINGVPLALRPTRPQ